MYENEMQVWNKRQFEDQAVEISYLRNVCGVRRIEGGSMYSKFIINFVCQINIKE